MNKLLTKKDLAERWQVSERTIDDYRLQGIIAPVKDLPCIRFNLQYIEKVEGFIPEKTTLRERELEKELEIVKKERDVLKNTIAEVNVIVTKTIYNLSNEDLCL